MAESRVCNIHCETKTPVRQYNVSWSIENFAALQTKPGDWIESRTFFTGHDRKLEWCMRLYPCDSSNFGTYNKGGGDSREYVTFSLISLNNCVLSAEVKLSMLNEKHDRCNIRTGKKLFSGKNDYFQFRNTLNREYLFDKKNGFLINNGITIICEIEIVDNPINEPVTYSSGSNLTDLSDNFLNLLTSQNLSDITILVGGKTFQAHKAILAARSSVFASRIGNLNEKSELEIADISPDVMEEILHYIYSGKCLNLKEKAMDILPATDIYNMPHLKTLCEDVLSKELKSANAASILILADSHKATKLKLKAIEFINNHGKEVLLTECWQTLIKSHPHLVLEAYVAIVGGTIQVKESEEPANKKLRLTENHSASNST